MFHLIGSPLNRYAPRPTHKMRPRLDKTRQQTTKSRPRFPQVSLRHRVDILSCWSGLSATASDSKIHAGQPRDTLIKSPGNHYKFWGSPLAPGDRFRFLSGSLWERKRHPATFSNIPAHPKVSSSTLGDDDCKWGEAKKWLNTTWWPAKV